MCRMCRMCCMCCMHCVYKDSAPRPQCGCARPDAWPQAAGASGASAILRAWSRTRSVFGPRSASSIAQATSAYQLCSCMRSMHRPHWACRLCLCRRGTYRPRPASQLARVCDVHTGYTLTISCVRAYGACRSCRAYTGHALPVSSARACGVYTCPDLHAGLRAVHQQEALLGNFVAGGSSASPRI